MKNIKKNRKTPLSEYILLGCVFSSILFSLFIFFIKEEPLIAIFVGLWAPTIMGLINYINLKFK